MLANATLTAYRQSPRKVRLVANLLKGKPVAVALIELRHRAKRAAPVMEKLIRSAVANAKALGMNEKTLTVQDIRVDKGPVLKRSMPRAHGRAFPIHKHTSHIVVSLSSAEVQVRKEKKGANETAVATGAKKTAVKK